MDSMFESEKIDLYPQSNFPVPTIDYIMTTSDLLEFVLAHPHIRWNYGALSRNPNISIQDVLKKPRKWNISTVGLNPAITIRDIFVGKPTVSPTTPSLL
jgi:hypothetical protein